MPFERSGSAGRSYVQDFARPLGTKTVEVVHAPGTPDELRFEVEALIQGEKGFFDLDTLIDDGDIVVTNDPRTGGTRELYVERIKINEVSIPGSEHLGHIAVKWGKRPAQEEPVAGTVYNGPVVTIHGGTNQVAWGNESVSQHQGNEAIAEGYADLAQAVTEALRLLADERNLDPDDQSIAREAGEAVLAEVTKPEPSPGAIKRGLATLRGVLTSAATAAATAGAGEAMKALVGSLVV